MAMPYSLSCAILTRRVLAASSCNHHFVSSWMAHNVSKHRSTDAKRQGQPSAIVPVGQSIRTVNPWRSYTNDSKSESTSTTKTAAKLPSTAKKKKPGKAKGKTGKKAKGVEEIDMKENDIYRDYMKEI
eukprot:scaffold12042_cov61-Phaeocystis_antarctica.AAC.4